MIPALYTNRFRAALNGDGIVRIDFCEQTDDSIAAVAMTAKDARSLGELLIKMTEPAAK